MNIRIVDCWGCGGDGGWDEPAAWTPTWFECPYCHGEGELEIQVEPVTLDDMQ